MRGMAVNQEEWRLTSRSINKKVLKEPLSEDLTIHPSTTGVAHRLYQALSLVQWVFSCINNGYFLAMYNGSFPAPWLPRYIGMYSK